MVLKYIIRKIEYIIHIIKYKTDWKYRAELWYEDQLFKNNMDYN